MSSPRSAGLLIVLFLIALVTVVSYFQAPRPYVRAASVWERFYYPIEINEGRRFFTTDVNLWSVFAAPDGRKVWIGGADGLIAGSADGGATWRVLRKFEDPYSLESVTSLQFRGDERGWAAVLRVTGQGIGDQTYTTILRSTDGGETWNRPAKMPAGIFRTMHFVDSRRGWAAGDGGAIIHTADGGKAWELQLAPAKQRKLVHIHFADARTGYAVGHNGIVLRTADGGKSWREGIIKAGHDMRYVRALDGETVIAANNRGAVFRSLNAGRQWTRTTSDGGLSRIPASVSGAVIYSFPSEKQACAANDQRQLYFARDEKMLWSTADPGIHPRDVLALHCLKSGLGWAVGEDGSVFHTRNGGESWRRQTSLNFFKVSMSTGRFRFAWSSERIYRSKDGGRAWSEVTGLPGLALTRWANYFLDWDRGWIAQFGGTVSRTLDGGKTWLPSSSRRGHFLNSIFFVDGFRGWGTGPFGELYRSADGGITWEKRPTNTRKTLRSVYFLKNAVNGWVAGHNILLRSSDGGASWKKTAVNGRLLTVRFTDEKFGWAAGLNGLLLYSRDGGITWRRQNSGTNHNITTVFFENRDNGYLFNGNHLLRRTTDGGRTWFQPRWYVLPAPWFFLVFSQLIVILFLILRKREPARETSIANRPVSDRPLREREEDRLNFTPLALGLSNFVRNENTIPPLTIAVTGEWGSGKSSLMNLVREDLALHRFDPIFFNAWHHQREEHLLAALLENVRLQGVPDWWRPRNWFFRARLFLIRTRENWPVLALMGVAYAFVLGLFHENLADLDGMRNFAGTIFDPALWEKGFLQGVAGAGRALGEGGGPLAFLAGNIALGGYLARMARAFGEHPAKLLAGLKGNFSIRDIKAKTGFRYRFSREFGDVTRALGARKMVLFIDDLDRCRPENVIDILETVNFLAGAGECVIFLGLALERVKKCVAMAFKDLAGGAESSESSEAFAEEYLKKLINIEVAVPRATSEQIGKLLDSDAARIKKAAKDPAEEKSKHVKAARDWWREAGRILLRHAPPVLTVLIIAATMGAMHQLGRILGPTASVQLQSGPTIRGGGHADIRANPGPAGGRRSPANRKKNPAPSYGFMSDYPSATVPSALTVFAFLLVLFMVRYVGWAQREADIVRDNIDFVDAWRIWRELVFVADSKPRAVKRFLNMVRLYAMRQRRSRPGLDTRQRIGVLARLFEAPKIEKTGVEDGGDVPQDFLVALCAIQFYKPIFLDKPEEILRAFKDPNHEIPGEPVLTACVQGHFQRFKRRYLPERYIKRLKFYQDGLQMN